MQTKQLYYKQGRRYVEFQPLLQATGTLYYQDEYGEFIPLNEETARWYMGRPSDGVWLVRDGGKSATRIGDFNITSTRIGLEQYRDKILAAMLIALKKRDDYVHSYNDIATYILENLEIQGFAESGTFDENVILFYVNWMFDRVGKSPSDHQIEEFKKESIGGIKHYIKKGYTLKDAFNKVVNGYSR